MNKCILHVLLFGVVLFSACGLDESTGCKDFLRTHGRPGLANSFFFEGVHFHNDICASEYRRLKRDLRTVLRSGEVPKAIVMIHESLVLVYSHSILEGNPYVLEKHGESWSVTENQSLKESYSQGFSYDLVAVLKESTSRTWAGMKLINLSPVKLYWSHAGMVDYLRDTGWGWNDHEVGEGPYWVALQSKKPSWGTLHPGKPIPFEYTIPVDADSFRVSIFLSDSKEDPKTIENLYWFTFSSSAQAETLDVRGWNLWNWLDLYEERPN